MKNLLKRMYEALPGKQSLFSVLRVFRPSHRIYQHLHFKGDFSVKVPGNYFKMRHYGYYIENGLFWEGIHGGEKHSYEAWAKLAARSKIILDVGANTGVFGLMAAAINPQAKVYAFEPLPKVFQKLKLNAQLNPHLPIEVFDYAISNADGEASFYDTGGEHSMSASLNPAHRNTGMEVKVRTCTLDTFINDHGGSVELVKIDVERFEPQVIEGFREHLKKHLPSILIEILDEEIGRKVEEQIKDLPYRYYSIDEEKGLRQVPHISQSDSLNYLICTERIAKEIGL